MTIEEKVREVALNLWRDSQGTSMYPNKEGDKQINQATQAILALIKPMSREGLVKLIGDIANKGLMDSKDTAQIIEDQAAAILAEWGKKA